MKSVLLIIIKYFTCYNKITKEKQQMSTIIELDEDQPNKLPHGLKLLLRSIFRSHEILCKEVIDEGKEIIFFVKASRTTYRLSTIWKFNLVGEKFSLQIQFYNRAEDDLLRAYTNRMKIQISILTRMINDYVLPDYSFLVDSQSGLLKLIYNVTWPTFNEKAGKKQNIYFLIMDIFSKLRKYDELMMFVEPMFNFKETKKEDNPVIVINRLRCLLKNTRNMRLQLQGCIGDLLRLKQVQNRELYRQQIEKIGNLYMRNIYAFQKSTIGLEDVSKFSIDNKIFKHELREIEKNKKGITNNQKSSRQTRLISSDRILLGLQKIQPIKDSNEKSMPQEGAHSQVNRKIFKFVIADTIYAGTISLMNHHHWIDNRTKQYSTQLAYKICNTTAQTSINSFKNQIKAIRHMKDHESPFIARYYLKIKDSWDENDTIYMNSYKQNVYHFIKNNKSCSIKTRLELSYKIAKGLCFLYSKQMLHRDFKPQNVVVDANLMPKIIDFGSAISQFNKNSFESHDERLLTTPGFHIQYHQLPQGYEYLRQKYTKRKYDQHDLFDVYGFGRTLCFIFFGSLNPPHPDSLRSQPMFEVLQNIIFIIQMCLNVDPDDRPGFAELTAFLGSLSEIMRNFISKQGIESDEEKSSD